MVKVAAARQKEGYIHIRAQPVYRLVDISLPHISGQVVDVKDMKKCTIIKF